MAPPRRQPPPPQGEPKTALVVALVFFILTTITLGALTYMFKSDNADALKQKQDAEGRASTAIKERDAAQARGIMDRIWLGTATPKDREAFVALKNDAATFNDELAALNAAFKDANIAWAPNSEAPSTNLAAKVKELQTAVLDGMNKLAAANAENTKNLTSFQENTASETAAKVAAQRARDTANKNELDAKAAKAKELDDALASIKDLREKLAKADQDRAASDNEKLKRIKHLEQTNEEKDRLIRKHQERLDLMRDDVYATDRPKGKITRIDNRNGVAYIDIGSAHFARPQLTFSIVSPSASGKGAGKRERKGALEIVKVLGDRLSQARIIDVTNALQDPIIEGDVLFNPAWDPNQRERVAITGLVDLNGDGLDDTAELVRRFEKLGVQVDAFLDLKSAEIKGSGITEGTGVLILGETPQAESSAVGAAVIGDKEKKKAEIRAKIQEMKDQAAKMGVQIVQARQYLKMAGFTSPRTQTPADFVPAGSLRPAAEAPAAPAKKPEGKDEGK